jgi:hypothetical protein
MLCLLSCPAQSRLDEEIHFYKPSTIRSEFFVQTDRAFMRRKVVKKWGLFVESAGAMSRNGRRIMPRVCLGLQAFRLPLRHICRPSNEDPFETVSGKKDVSPLDGYYLLE